MSIELNSIIDNNSPPLLPERINTFSSNRRSCCFESTCQFILFTVLSLCSITILIVRLIQSLQYPDPLLCREFCYVSYIWIIFSILFTIFHLLLRIFKAFYCFPSVFQSRKIGVLLLLVNIGTNLICFFTWVQLILEHYASHSITNPDNNEIKQLPPLSTGQEIFFVFFLICWLLTILNNCLSIYCCSLYIFIQTEDRSIRPLSSTTNSELKLVYEKELKSRFYQSNLFIFHTLNQEEQKEEEKLSCIICFQDVEMGLGSFCSIKKCKHSFHTDCLLKWFLQNLSCPLCRNIIKL